MAFQRDRIKHTFGNYEEAHWFVQKPPFITPLWFTTTKMKGITIDSRYPDPQSSVGPGSGLYTTLVYEFPGSSSYDNGYRQAYDAFVGKAKSSASLGLTALEGKQSFNMIANRLKQVVEVYRACRRGNIEGITKSLGISGKTPKARRASRRTRDYHNPKSSSYIRDESKRTASTYLEWIFGWKPLVQDIGDAIEVLQREFPIQPISGSGAGVSNDVVGQWPYGPDDKQTFLVHTKVRIKGIVHVSNPNIALANQLGFVNPAQVAWEAVPFSFLVDWFVPINRFLGSMSDLWGFSIERTCISAKRTASRSSHWSFSSVSVSTEENGTSFHRRPVSSLPIPGLWSRVKFPKPDFSRAATLAALATQVFSGSSR